MNDLPMTSLGRVLTALSHKEPDRVPFLLPVSIGCARDLGMSIKEYFSDPEQVVEGQLRARAKYGHDFLSAFYYGPIEIEAFGGEVLFFDDGPPNSGRPFIRSPEDIERFRPPDVEESPCLTRVLRTAARLKAFAAGEVPIVGVVMSPFSLPVMQMGFDRYLDLLYGRPDLFERLMQINEEFCVQWANAQLAAGVTAVVYFDPVSSPTVLPKEMYLKTGYPVAVRTLARIKGPVATHLASGRCAPIIDELAQTGTAIIGVSVLEDLAELKEAARGKVTLLGNLNAIEMRRWTVEEAEAKVKEAIAKGGPGGGFILADNHGEIPWQVPEEILLAISEAVHTWGIYPLEWATGDAR